MAVTRIPMLSARFKRPFQGYIPGKTYSFAPGYADSLRRAGYIEIVPDEVEVRQAVTPEPPAVEQAVKPRRRRKK